MSSATHTTSSSTQPYRFLPCPGCGKLLANRTDNCPDCNYRIAPIVKDNKYPVLLAISILSKTIACFLALFYLVNIFQHHFYFTEFFDDTIHMVCVWAIFWGIGEIIIVLVDIETNTRKAAQIKTASERHAREEYQSTVSFKYEKDTNKQARLDLAKPKISPELHTVFSDPNNVIPIKIELSKPIRQETFARCYEFMDFELLDARPTNERTAGHITKTIDGFILVEFLADMAISPTVEQITGR
jgi:hypothetical protein